MKRTGERSNYFMRKGCIIMCSPGKEDKAVSSVSGSFVGIKEKVVRKMEHSTHWIVIELDNDNVGPTKGVYLDAKNFNSVCGIVAMYRLGVVLKEGDSLTFSAGKGATIRIELNGCPVLLDKEDEGIFQEQDNSFESMLDAIRGEHQEIDFWNHAEIDCFIKVRNLVREYICLLDKDAIKSIVQSNFLPDIKPDSSFEEIYPQLLRKLNE